jgi:hypothetical protein
MHVVTQAMQRQHQSCGFSLGRNDQAVVRNTVAGNSGIDV